MSPPGTSESKWSYLDFHNGVEQECSHAVCVGGGITTITAPGKKPFPKVQVEVISHLKGGKKRGSK